MYCPECGCSFPKGVEYCTYCGRKLIDVVEETENPEEAPEEKKAVVTPPEVEFPEDRDKNAKIMVGLMERAGRKCRDFWDLLTAFNKVMTVLTLVCAVLGLTAFLFDKILAGVLAILSFVLLIAAWLLHSQILKHPNLHLYKILMAAALVLLIPYFFSWRIVSQEAKPQEPPAVTEPGLSWPAHPMARLLPQPESGTSEVLLDAPHTFSAAVTGISRENFESYCGMCIAAGFQEKTAEHPDFLAVRNGSGYDLSVHYSEDGRMVVTLRAPIRKAELKFVCEENQIFSTYAVDILVDGELLGTLEHGSSDRFTLELKDGVHELQIRNADKNSVSNTQTITVSGDFCREYHITCHFGHVDIAEQTP